MTHFIREIDKLSASEVELVAARMRLTLVEVVGPGRGASMYSLDWLRDRVLWHLDSGNTNAKVFLSENQQSEITGQAIARVEHDEVCNPYGYFSTLYVDPKFRRIGVATQLLLKVENWFRSLEMPKINYNTGSENSKLIDLFKKHGFIITFSEGEMVQLTKFLRP